LAANPPTDAKASQTDAGSGCSPVDMVVCAIATVQQLDLCEQCNGWNLGISFWIF
jgi:hypothetical protein